MVRLWRPRLEKPQHYTTLEGMRGIGAMFVVMAHGEALFGWTAPQSAYLGVDFFFALSGFIVAHVYLGPLQRGLPRVAFLTSRLLRLYPVYVLGILSGVVLAAQSALIAHDPQLWAYTKPFVSLPFAIALLPSPASDAMFPLDIPAWSLLVEFIASILIAFRVLRTTQALLAMMLISGALLLVALNAYGDLNVGWSKETGLFGLARICFSFPLGFLTYRLRNLLRVPGWFYVVPFVALTAVVYVDPTGPARAAYAVLFLCVISPALLLAGSAANPTNPTVIRLCNASGALSYPLYALHYPTLMAAIGAITRHVPAGTPTHLATAAMLAMMVAVAYYVSEIDAVVRGYLTRLLRDNPVYAPLARRPVKIAGGQAQAR